MKFHFTDQNHKKIVPTVFEGRVGTSIRLVCHGADAVWFYEAYNLKPIHPPIKFGETFTITDMQLEHSGNYFCYAKNSKKAGQFLAKSTVKVVGESLSIWLCLLKVRIFQIIFPKVC